MIRFLVSFGLCAAAVWGQAWCSEPRRAEFRAAARVASADPWFEVYQLRAGEFAIYEPRQEETVLSYLIVGTERALLFDSGLGIGQMDRVVRGLTKLPVIVVNSHTHYDHVGGNSGFGTVWGVDSDYTRLAARGKSNEVIAETVLGDGLTCGALPAGVSKSTYSVKPFRIAKYLRDGERIELGGRTLEVLLTPGHTPDALCLLDRESRELFTGDTYYPGSLWLWAPETNLDAYQKSIERLAEVAGAVDVLRPAHNAPSAPPAVLAKVAAGLRAIRSGAVKASPGKDGKRRFEVDGVRFVMGALGEPRVLELKGTVYHVQGVDVEGSRIWVSSVDAKAKKGYLHLFDRASGALVRSVEVQDGARFHPGGLSVDGDAVWVPVAEYRRESSAVIQKRDKVTLALLASFLAADHIGCLAAGKDVLIGGNWDSREFYVWDRAGRLLRKVANSTGNSFQDLKFVGEQVVGGGLLKGKGGAVDWMSYPGLDRVRRIEVGQTDRGRPYTQEGMTVREGHLFLLPEDGPTRLFQFELSF